MESRFVAVVLMASAGLLAGTALATGPLAAFATAPLALGLGLVAARVWREVGPRTPRWVVTGGLLTMAFGLVMAVAGPFGAALATAIAGLAATLCGTRLALRFEPPPGDIGAPSPPDARVVIGVAVEEALKLAWDLTGRVKLEGDPRRLAEELRAAAQRNAERGWLEHPEHAHPAPPPLEKPTLVAREMGRLGRVEHLLFASEHEPADPEVRTAYLGFERNRTAHVYLWRHRDGPRPALILLHGHGMRRVGLAARALDVPWLHQRLGLDLALAVLPLHGPRAMGRRAGAGFLDGHPLWTSTAVAQAMWDLRRLAGWLRAQGAPAIGVAGGSLGGYMAALLASLEPGLACAIPMVPPTSLSAFMWSRLTEPRRWAAEAAGIDEALLERAWAPQCPLRHQPQVALEGRLILAARVDRIVPPEHPHALWKHWDQPAIRWFPGTHLFLASRWEVRERLETHLRGTLLAAARPSAPPLTRFRT